MLKPRIFLSEFDEQVRFRRQAPSEQQLPLRRQGPGAELPLRRQYPISDEEEYNPNGEQPERRLEYFPIPPVNLDQAGAGSDLIDRGYHKHKPGKVGPVYTFVKTDPYAHVKWGVRHVAGKKYAGHH